MSEWWTYSLSDFLMYTPQTYERLLAAYNTWLYPAQLPAFALGVWLAWIALRGNGRQLRVGLALLGVCWLWIAWAFFWQWLATIDLAAPYYAYAFAIQGALLLGAAFALPDPLPPVTMFQRVAATLLIDIAIVLIPLALRTGDWDTASMFGLAPDATAVATLGVVAVLGRARGLLAIPLLWCAVSAALLWALGQPQGVALLLLGAAALGLIVRERFS